MANQTPTIVTINGTDYYVPNDSVDDLIISGNHLINISSNTVYLYGEFREYGNNYSGYPRITCPSNTYAYITQSYNSSYQTLNVSSFEVKQKTLSDTFLMTVIIIGILTLMLFKKR